MEEYRSENIFDVLLKVILNGRFDSVIVKDPAYQSIMYEISKLTEQINASNFAYDQKQLINQLADVYEKNSNYYIRLVYCQAYKDCVLLLKAMDLLK